MGSKRMRAKVTFMIMGTASFLIACIAVFSTGDQILRIYLVAAILSVLFFLLVYFQLKFYRDGDIKCVQNSRKLPTAAVPPTPGYLKSPHHRTIWKNMEQTKSLMQQKEKEFHQAQKKKEALAMGLPQQEEILFMADRSGLYVWPAALFSLVFLFFAAASSKDLSPAFSFACLVLSLLGLLLLTIARFRNRYYMTNFRILLLRKVPLRKDQWFSLNYPEISTLSRGKKLGWEELSLKSDERTIRIWGLSKQNLGIMLNLLDKMGTVTGVPNKR